MRSTILRQIGFTVLLLASASLAARANQLFTTTTQLTAADPTQLGRISRSGIPSDWSVAKAYPGLINAATVYNYHTYTVNPSPFGLQYVQVIVDWGVGTNAFAAAYIDSYDPTNLATNYLGDIGASGNSFGNPGSFQVQVTPGHSVVIVVSSAVSGAGGLNSPYSILVEGFTTTLYTNSALPTAAGVSVAGRVTTSANRGIANATVTITGSDGKSRSVTTNILGYYQFEDIEAGKAYVVSVASARFQFTPRTVTLNDALSDLNFVAGQ